MTTIIHLSWPVPALWANNRAHWSTKAKAIKRARNEAWAVAKEAGIGRAPGARLRFTFHPPDDRRRDAQNLPATVKAHIDGIADAMGCDDSNFAVTFPTTLAEPSKGGLVVVEVEKLRTPRRAKDGSEKNT